MFHFLGSSARELSAYIEITKCCRPQGKIGASAAWKKYIEEKGKVGAIMEACVRKNFNLELQTKF